MVLATTSHGNIQLQIGHDVVHIPNLKLGFDHGLAVRAQRASQSRRLSTPIVRQILEAQRKHGVDMHGIANIEP